MPPDENKPEKIVITAICVCILKKIFVSFSSLWSWPVVSTLWAQTWDRRILSSKNLYHTWFRRDWADSYQYTHYHKGLCFIGWIPLLLYLRLLILQQLYDYFLHHFIKPILLSGNAYKTQCPGYSNTSIKCRKCISTFNFDYNKEMFSLKFGNWRKKILCIKQK